MVVCKYFLQGTCKYGNKCKFEHTCPDPNEAGKSIMRPRNSGYPSIPPIDTATLVKSVQTDMINVEKGGQWLLSSYAPFKEKGTFPGFVDQSFEEVRCGFYEATATGTVDQYKQGLNETLQTAVHIVKTLQNPNEQVAQTLQQIYNTPLGQVGNQHMQAGFGNSPFGSATSPFASNSPFGGTATNSMFGGGGGAPTNSPFGAQPVTNSPFASTFATNSPFQTAPNSNSPFAAVPANPGVFGGQTSNNMFGSAATGSFGGQAAPVNTGIFGGQGLPPNTGIFGGQGLPPSSGIFGGQTASTGSGSVGVFGGQQPAVQGESIFAKAAQTFVPQQSMQQQQVMQQPQVMQQQQAMQQQPLIGFGNPNIMAQGAQRMPFGSTAPATHTAATSNFVSNSPLRGQTPTANMFAPAAVGQPTNATDSGAAKLPVETFSNYSERAQLNTEQIHAFEAEAFLPGQIPIMPPPEDMC